MPDFFGVYDDLTAKEYLHFFAAAYKISTAKRAGIVGDVLALTDLTAKTDAPVDGLSRGMKQRLGLARVLLHDRNSALTSASSRRGKWSRVGRCRRFIARSVCAAPSISSSPI